MTINSKWQEALGELKRAGVTIKEKGSKLLLCKGDMMYTIHLPHKGKPLGKDMVSNLRKFL